RRQVAHRGEIMVEGNVRAARIATARRVEGAVHDAVTRSLYSVGAEPAPYRFRGLEGESFIRDLATASRFSAGENREVDDAVDRFRRFEQWSQDVAFASQTTSSASQIIPPGYKNAVEIALTADRPLASACESAEIANSAPFTVPTATGSTLVDPNRTEASNP